MIALAILALGLLVIGAALPIGLRYTRQSVNMATGQAAAEYALDTIAQSVCLRRKILDPGGTAPKPLNCEPGLFQPRNASGLPQEGELAPDPNDVLVNPTNPRDYEPLFKVRPLYVRNIIATAPPAAYGRETLLAAASVETAIDTYLKWISFSSDTRERDYLPLLPNLPWMLPALASVASVYPPIAPDPAGAYAQYTPAVFYSSVPNSMYAIRPVYSSYTPTTGAETSKVLNSLISWTAFYRRVAYDDPATTTLNEADPTLYEFIAVAVKRPSVKHRFPVQDPLLTVYNNVDVAAPIPWLVTFDVNGLPAPSGGFDPLTGFPVGVSPGTLTFHCTTGVSGLLPVGAIFIPARNDIAPSNPSGITPDARVGFGPPAPTTLPIYEVVQRPNDFTVVTKFNGYYPMMGMPNFTPSPTTPNADLWPVWVIPPAFEELSGGQPVFDGRSQILAVARRYIRLRELP